MNEAEVSRFITETFEGVDTVVNLDNIFFFYNPPDEPPDHMFPFATLMVNDINDKFSNLDRASVFRLNIGVSKQTFLSLFGEPGPRAEADGADGGYPDYDFTALDRVMPHPVYGRMRWLCVLNPSDVTFKMKALPLLEEAYKMAVKKRRKK